MQGASKQPGQQTSVKIYNAVYSSVQVYECMVRGIAVMRRRADSYVNATQILKVAGVDKGRRTKILEKEILPGKHEIVQGGYGKYQGTWIPLERGRELAAQYGIAPLLSPLFDFTPTQQGLGGLSNQLSGLAGLTRPLTTSASFPNLSTSNYSSASSSGQLGPAPIMPGSALRLLNQGRAQGLFTPSTSSLLARSGNPGSPGSGWIPGLIPGYASQPSSTNTSGQSENSHSLKRTHTESEIDSLRLQTENNQNNNDGHLQQHLGSLIDLMGSRPASSTPPANNADGPSPTKRARTDPPNPQLELNSHIQAAIQSMSRHYTSPPLAQTNGLVRAESNGLASTGSRSSANGAVNDSASRGIKMATKPPYPRNNEKLDPSKNPKRVAIMTTICQGDNSEAILNVIKEASPPIRQDPSSSQHSVDLNIIIDDLGHSPLHLAASLGHLETVKALVANGADIHRGNYQGETPLIRSVLSTHNYDEQTFPALLEILHPSIRTMDSAKRSVLHHAALTAGVKGRAPFARYYLEGVLAWIAQNDNADFRGIVDLQDENGDTALNISARVGNKGLVRTLLDVGADRSLANKLGLRPGDFGVDPELTVGAKNEDMIASLRMGPPAPLQKSQEVITDLTNMIQKLSTEFALELKAKQDAYDVSNIHVRAATRELAEQRKQVDFWKQQHGEIGQVLQRVRNVEKALTDEDNIDWTGRTEANGDIVTPGSGNPAFVHRGPQSTALGESEVQNLTQAVVSEPPIPATNSLASLIRLRRMKLFQDKIEKILRDRLQSLQGASAEKEYQGKRIVALCTGMPIDKVEQMLDDLLVAVESESSLVDFGRVSGFMQKVNETR